MPIDRKNIGGRKLIRRGRPSAEVLELRQLLATIFVTTTADTDGADGGSALSLRQAIEVANGTLAVGSLTGAQARLVVGALAGTNTIDFAIPGVGPFTIEPTFSLPGISNPVVIDGYSQAGARANTNGPGLADNAVIQIALNGERAGTGSSGLEIHAGGTTVQGLAIGGFRASVIGLDGNGAGITLEDTGGDLIQGNFIGTDSTGTRPEPNDVDGIDVVSRSSTIGGTAAGARNIIAYNRGNGVSVSVGFDVSTSSDHILSFLTESEVDSGQFNTISGNSIFDNLGRGIQLNGAVESAGRVGIFGRFLGSITSFPGEPAGANALLNPPTILPAVLGSHGSAVSGTVSGAPSSRFTVELFDGPAFGRGNFLDQRFLGSIVVTADAAGNAPFTFVTDQLLGDRYVTATATDALGNTSGFAVDTYSANRTSTVLVGPSNGPALGHPVAFAATVTSTRGSTPTGLVAFVAGATVLGFAPLDASGIATFVTTLPKAGFRPITAAYIGDLIDPPSLSNALPPTLGGPTVTAYRATTANTIRLTFGEPLLAATARDRANYAIVGPGGHALAIRSAVYNPGRDSVTLTTRQKLDPRSSYRVTVNGRRVGRVDDIYGIPLDGRGNGSPGSSFVGSARYKPPVRVGTHPTVSKRSASVPKKGH